MVHTHFRLLAIILALIIVIFLDRQYFRQREPDIANRYPCPIVNPSDVQYNTDLNFNGTVEKRYRLPDGTTVQRVESSNSTHKPDLLILTLVKDANSYGHDKGQPVRTLQDYLKLLLESGLDLRHVSLGLATESQEEFEHMETAIKTLTVNHGYFPHLTLLLNKPSTSATDRGNRHQLTLKAQNVRRSYIAQLRNTLTFHSLRSESQVLWLDADINFLSPNIIQTMLAHQYSKPAAGIITARCQEGPTFDYDKNAWAGERFREGDARADTRRNVAELIKHTDKDDLIPLSSVGGTILMIRSTLISRGLLFPVTPIVGAEWNKVGWDGIETEGLCMLAKGLEDELGLNGCFVLGGHHYVGHTNF